MHRTAAGQSRQQTGPCDALGGTWVGISKTRYDEVELLTQGSAGFMHAMDAKGFRYLYDGVSSTLGPAEKSV